MHVRSILDNPVKLQEVLVKAKLWLKEREDDALEKLKDANRRYEKWFRLIGWRRAVSFGVEHSIYSLLRQLVFEDAVVTKEQMSVIDVRIRDVRRDVEFFSHIRHHDTREEALTLVTTIHSFG